MQEQFISFIGQDREEVFTRLKVTEQVELVEKVTDFVESGSEEDEGHQYQVAAIFDALPELLPSPLYFLRGKPYAQVRLGNPKIDPELEVDSLSIAVFHQHFIEEHAKKYSSAQIRHRLTHFNELYIDHLNEIPTYYALELLYLHKIAGNVELLCELLPAFAAVNPKVEKILTHLQIFELMEYGFRQHSRALLQVLVQYYDEDPGGFGLLAKLVYFPEELIRSDFFPLGLEVMREAGVKLDQVDIYGDTALHRALSKANSIHGVGREAQLPVLLYELGVNASIPNRYGRTARELFHSNHALSCVQRRETEQQMAQQASQFGQVALAACVLYLGYKLARKALQGTQQFAYGIYQRCRKDRANSASTYISSTSISTVSSRP